MFVNVLSITSKNQLTNSINPLAIDTAVFDSV